MNFLSLSLDPLPGLFSDSPDPPGLFPLDPSPPSGLSPIPTSKAPVPNSISFPIWSLSTFPGLNPAPMLDSSPPTPGIEGPRRSVSDPGMGPSGPGLFPSKLDPGPKLSEPEPLPPIGNPP